MRRILFAILLSVSPAFAEQSQPLDLGAVDADMLTAFLGPWQIQNADGSKVCDVSLSTQEVAGGMALDMMDDCEATFPVMGKVAAWRLDENWTIVLLDTGRNELIRFTTPDDAYVATPVLDGITTIVQPD